MATFFGGANACTPRRTQKFPPREHSPECRRTSALSRHSPAYRKTRNRSRFPPEPGVRRDPQTAAQQQVGVMPMKSEQQISDNGRKRSRFFCQQAGCQSRPVSLRVYTQVIHHSSFSHCVSFHVFFSRLWTHYVSQECGIDSSEVSI